MTHLEAPEEDYYVCLCGNRPHEEGYQPVDHSGLETHPGPEWSGLIRCGRCDRLIDTTTYDPMTGTVRGAY